MTQRFAIYAGLLAVALAGSAPAVAQVVPAYPPAGAFPPHEAVALVRSAGLEPVTRPVRNGPAYVLQAVNPAGREVRVIVDIRLKRIARVVLLGPRVAAAGVPPLPAPYTRPPAGIATVPDGYGPGGRVAGLSPEGDSAAPYGVDPDAPYGPGAGTGTLPPAATGRAPSAAAAPARASPPPLPRPRPKLAAAEPVAPASQPSAANATSKPAAPAAAAASVPPPAAASVAEPVYEQHE